MLPNKRMLHQPACYRICVQGVVDESWHGHFGGMSIRCAPANGPGAMTTLTGQVIDQAMLVGMLNYLYDLGCCLLMVERLAER